MTLGLWLKEEHLNDIDPVIRYLNFDRPYFDMEQRCKTLSVEIGLRRFTEEELSIPCSVPKEREGRFGLYLRPGEREWFKPHGWCSSDSCQLFFDSLTEMMDFACGIKMALNEAGLKTSWDLDFFSYYAKEVRKSDALDKAVAIEDLLASVRGDSESDEVKRLRDVMGENDD